MNFPRLTFLVHGRSDSIEAVRARGLAQQYPPEKIRFLFRETTRAITAKLWREDLRAHPPELLYVLNTALPGVPLALEKKFLKKIPFLLDTGDVIYEMARASGINAGWRLPFLRVTETLAQRHARAIVVRGTRHREHLQTQGLRDVTVIRDGYVPAPPPAPANLAVLRKLLGLRDDFIVGVMGSLVFSPRLGICYGWDLVRALTELRDLPVRGLVIGDGPGRPWLENLAYKCGVKDRLIFAGRIPYTEVPTHLRLLDIALSTQTNNLPGQVRTTGKLPEYLAAERFILATRVGEAALVLPDAMLLDYAGAVDPTYPHRLAARIRTLIRDPQTLALRHQLPALAEKLFSYQTLSTQFNALLAAL